MAGEPGRSALSLRGVTKRYGEVFRRSLPSTVRVFRDSDGLLGAVAKFMRDDEQKGNAEYRPLNIE